MGILPFFIEQLRKWISYQTALDTNQGNGQNCALLWATSELGDYRVPKISQLFKLSCQSNKYASVNARFGD